MINHGFRYPLDPLQVIYQVGYLELKNGLHNEKNVTEIPIVQ